MKSRIVYILTAVAAVGAMGIAGQNSPRASDPPATTPPATAAAAPTLPPTGEDLRKRVAINEFGYSAVIPMAQLIFNPGLEKKKKVTVAPVVPNIGAGIEVMLITRLSEAGKVVIVDKDVLDQIKKMQVDAISIRNQQGKGPRLGAIRAPDLLLAGDVVVFGRDDKKMGVEGGSSLCRYCGLAGVFNKEEDKAVVKITYRLINGETGEVLKSGDVSGQSVRKSRGFGSLASANGKGGGVVFNMGSTNFAQTIIGEATQDCVKNLADKLNEQLAMMKHSVHEVEGMVAAASGDTVTLNVGSNDGVNAGDLFVISRSTGDVKDPVTGEVIDRILEKKGEMTVTTVKERVAIGTYTGTPAEPKDIATRKTAAGEQK
jgi:curli biogenesis system outer membrane secretion channel CsgG